MTDDSHWSKARIEALWEGFGGTTDSATPQGKKRVRLIQAASELFGTLGYRKTSVEDIARRAGVAKGTVYNFFPNKAALMIEAIAVEKRVMLQVLAPIIHGTLPPEQRLRFYVQTVLTSTRELPLTTQLLLRPEDLAEITHELGHVMTAERYEYGARMVMELIEMAAPGALPEDVKRARAFVLQGFGVMAVKILDPMVRGPISFEQYVEVLTDVLVAGTLAATGSGRP